MKKLLINKTENRQSSNLSAKQIVLSIFFIAISFTCYAQDIIILKDSKRIEAKVIEINMDNIRFRQSDNMEDPLFTIPKNDIVSITFQNGLIQTFEPTTSIPAQTTLPNNTVYNLDNRKLTTNETLLEMQINYPELYSKYNAGRRMRKTGWVLTGTGIATAFIGGMTAATSMLSLNFNQSKTGETIATVGICIIGGGVTVLAIGSGARRRSLRAFDSQYYAMKQQHSQQFQLNIHPNSVGLAYVF